MKAYRLSKEELYHMRRLEKYGSTYSFDRWPEIYWGTPPKKPQTDLSEFDIPENKFDADYLGMYIYSYNREGHIELFEERITDCAERISDDLFLNFEDVFRDLCFIVLMHELGHWFTHWCHLIEYSPRRKQFSNQPIEVKETLAQLTVMWSMMRLSNPSVNQKKKIFFHLVDNQSAPYREVLRFDNFFTKKGTILKRFNHLLDEKEWGIDYLFDGKKHETPEEASRRFIRDFLKKS